MDNGQNGLGRQPATFGGNQPVMGGNAQPFAPNNFSNNFNAQNSSGDIVLTPDAKKPKTGLIVGLLVGLVVVAIIIIISLILVNGQGDSKSMSSYTKDYLNLLTTGSIDNDFDKSDLELSAISSDDLENIYIIPRFYSSLEDKNVTYYNELQELLDGIKNNSNNDEQIGFWVDDSKTMLSYYFVASALAYTNSDYEYFLENKRLDGFLAVYGYPFAEPEDEMLSDFAATINALYNSKKELYNEISKTSCVQNVEINYVCLSEVGSTQIEAIQSRNSDLTSAEEVQAEKMLIIILTDARKIYDLTIGGANE